MNDLDDWEKETLSIARTKDKSIIDVAHRMIVDRRRLKLRRITPEMIDLSGKTLLEALITIARHSFGYLMPVEAMTVLSQSGFNVERGTNIYNTLKRHGDIFQKVEAGLYLLIAQL